MLRVIKKFRKILNGKQIAKLFILGFLMIIGAAIETLSVSAIIPLVTVLFGDGLMENKYVQIICNLFKIQDAQKFLIIMIVALIIIYILKNVFLLFEYYVQSRFVCNNRFLTQRKLLASYVFRPYDFFLDASSGEIIRIINNDTTSAFLLLSSLLQLFTEGIICIALVVTIIVIDPAMAIAIALILSVTMLLVYKGIKPWLRKAGLQLQRNAATANKWLLQSIGGIKDVKVSQKENYFIEQYAYYGKKSIDAEKVNSVLVNVPKLILETVLVSGVLSVIAVLLLGGRDVSTLLPQLTAFAMAAIRLLPGANRISASLNSISFYEPMLDSLLNNLKQTKEWEREEQSETAGNEEQKQIVVKKIQADNISFSYPQSDKKVFDKANMEIKAGESIGIVGSSGAGKTTVVDILLGLLKPQVGKILVNDVDIENDYSTWLSRVAYIPQNIYMLDDTIYANIAFGTPIDKQGDEKIWEALKEAQLDEFVKSLPNGLQTAIGERGVRLSGGQRQRIGIARALYANPEVLIFDEATSALDNETEAAIMDAINCLHGKKTLIIIAHRLSTIEGCDRIYRVENGKICEEKK